MNVSVGRLRPLLIAMLGGSPSPVEVTELVHLSRSIIHAYLFAYQPASVQLCLRHGLTLTDLAYDCIGDAFTRDGAGSFIHLHGLAGSLREAMGEIAEHELFLAYKGFLSAFADAQLARLYAQADPAGAKIHRNVQLHLKTHADLEAVKQFGVMVVRPRRIPAIESCPVFPADTIESLLMTRARAQHSIPELLAMLFEILAGQSEYRRSLPLLDAVRLFKSVYVNDSVSSDGDGSGDDRDGVSPSEVRELREGVEAALKEKIFLTYVIRGKVTPQTGEALLAAMSDILGDWCETGSMEKGLREYVHNHLPVEPSVFEEEYRTKMEYLVRIARAEMHARLMKSL